jgi:DNA-binding response OmpR family regulator
MRPIPGNVKENKVNYMIKRVLILDNDPDVLDAMQEVLVYSGFEVKTIEDTDNIFPIIYDFRPDVLLVDYILNGINGGEICHQIKTNPRTSHLPVIILSAYPRVINSLGFYGCDSFIAKPFELDDLVGQVSFFTMRKAV